MLPFLEPKKMSTTIMASHGKSDLDANSEVGMDGDMKEAAADCLRAIEEKSPIALAHALKACFEIYDSQPHDEGEHTYEEE